jgi:integrase
MVPKVVSAKREIWTAETLFRALKLCEDPRLALALNLSFCCSLRIGEMLGLTWDCVDISPESIKNNTPAVSITKELQRVSREILDELEEKDVQFTFPAQSPNAATVLVLKRPKTESSIRKVFMPRAVAEMLVSWKAMQEAKRKELDMEYKNYDLVFTGELGYPLEGNTLGKALRRLIKENDLPPVVFHSFRHASVTYKLKLNGGDIKSVQGDTGHAQANMVTEVYSHILDDSRQNNALLFQQAFYERQKTDAEEAITSKLPDGLSAEKLAKLLAKPEVKSVLMALAGSMEES